MRPMEGVVASDADFKFRLEMTGFGKRLK